MPLFQYVKVSGVYPLLAFVISAMYSKFLIRKGLFPVTEMDTYWLFWLIRPLSRLELGVGIMESHRIAKPHEPVRMIKQFNICNKINRMVRVMLVN